MLNLERAVEREIFYLHDTLCQLTEETFYNILKFVG